MTPEKTALTLGFVPLTDSALLAVAKDRGLFEAEGLDVILSREASWANIRDKVALGVLDGAHMLAPMALAMTLGNGDEPTPMAAPMALNVNGSSLGVSTALAEALPQDSGLSAAGLKRVLDRRRAEGGSPPTFAVVFPHSLHNYMLRYWLAEAGIDPDADVRITVVPPPRIPERIAAGDVDGFCVGAPWGGAIEAAGAGRMLLHGAQFWPGAPDKVLGLTRAWAKAHPNTLQALLRALVRAAAWADAPENETELAALLSQPDYVGVPAAALGRALSKANPFGLRFHAGGAGRPRPEHALWLFGQMRRWGQVGPGGADTAAAVYRPDLYAKALAETGIAAEAPGPLPPFYDGAVFDLSHVGD
jgi:NitT/TauT family transport system ATP-binding protein/nitrate/nitrite transport system substrate-binding protein